MITKRLLGKIGRDEKGITGLETAIILIAFVVVASVFAYTVLSAGLFSTQKSQEAVYSGLEETRSSLEVKGAVLSEGLSMVENCEDDWTAVEASSATVNSTDYIEGSSSVQIATINTTDIQAYKNVPSNGDWDLSNCDNAYFWVRSSQDLTSGYTDGHLQLVFSQSQNLTSQEVTVDIPGEAVDSNWHRVESAISGTRNSINSVGIYCANVTGVSGDLYIDAIETDAFQDLDEQPVSYADNVVFTVSNALKGEPIDFTEPKDSDDDGVPDADSNHKVIVSYSDRYQQKDNIDWTKSAVGNDDGDNLLESNEKFQITVDMKAINNEVAERSKKISEDRTFTLEIKPPQGAVLNIERTMPSVINQINNLR